MYRGLFFRGILYKERKQSCFCEQLDGSEIFFSFTLVITASVFFGCSRKAGAAPFSEQEADLVIYSPHASDKTESIIREFRQRTGLRAKIVHQGTSELIGRLAAEENNGSTAADVFWGGGTETLEVQNTFCAI